MRKRFASAGCMQQDVVTSQLSFVAASDIQFLKMKNHNRK
jgi:hypothetical protein